MSIVRDERLGDDKSSVTGNSSRYEVGGVMMVEV
jgi:hypothetical protein